MGSRKLRAPNFLNQNNVNKTQGCLFYYSFNRLPVSGAAFSGESHSFMNHSITLTLTIGKRPVQLLQTLESLLEKVSFAEVIAVNDFRDEETNTAFRQICPSGILLCPSEQLGHHGAIDALYQRVKTPLVFHCEDDWHFDKVPDLAAAAALLESHSDLTAVCFRQVEDFGLPATTLEQIPAIDTEHGIYKRLDVLHDQWHGYTFNPHLITTETLRSIGNFSRFKKERHVSRFLRKQGKHVAYMQPGACHHIGFENSVSHPNVNKPSVIKRLFNYVRGK